MEKWLWFYCKVSVTLQSFKIHFANEFNSRVLQKNQMFFCNKHRNLGQVSVIANDMVFLKKKQLFIEKMAWFYCSSVLYVVLEHLYANLITAFFSEIPYHLQ